MRCRQLILLTKLLVRQPAVVLKKKLYFQAPIAQNYQRPMSTTLAQAG
jgi:hypothetical protein